MNSIILILPEIIISVMACTILILDLFIKTNKNINYYLILTLTSYLSHPIPNHWSCPSRT